MEQTARTFNTVNLERFQSLNAAAEAGNLSGRYSFIPTKQVVDVFGQSGWLPVRVSEGRIVKPEKAGFQKHIIRFRQDGIMPTLADPVFPEIVLTNSHDGLAAFNIFFGMFRLVCSNGAVVSDSTFASHRIKHVGYTDEKVALAIDNVIESIPRIVDRVDQFRQIELKPHERLTMAKAALVIKYKAPTYPEGHKYAGKIVPGQYGENGERTFNPARLLTPWRAEDRKTDLWTTFNVIQEKLMKGGRYETKTTTWTDNYYGPQTHTRNQKARAVNNISENVRINRLLWTLTENMVGLQGKTLENPDDLGELNALEHALAAGPILEGEILN